MMALEISDFMIGRIVDGATADGSNMGAAMAPAAYDTIAKYFAETGKKPGKPGHLDNQTYQKIQDMIHEL